MRANYEMLLKEVIGRSQRQLECPPQQPEEASGESTVRASTNEEEPGRDSESIPALGSGNTCAVLEPGSGDEIDDGHEVSRHSDNWWPSGG